MIYSSDQLYCWRALRLNLVIKKATPGPICIVLSTNNIMHHNNDNTSDLRSHVSPPYPRFRAPPQFPLHAEYIYKVVHIDTIK